jgi:hypothetical protein
MSNAELLADLLGQGDNDALGAAEVAEPIHILVLCDLAEKFGAVGAQAGDGVVDVVDGKHDTMQAQRVGGRVLGVGGTRLRVVVLRQLQLAIAVRSPQHGDVAADAVEADSVVGKRTLDLHLALQLHAKFSEERYSSREIVDNNADVVHPFESHMSGV